MPGAAVDIRIIGNEETIRALSQLPERSQKKVVGAAQRKSLAWLRRRVIESMAGSKLPVRTGFTLGAFVTDSAMRFRRKHGMLRAIMFPPTRATLGIPSDYKWYYPWALEYGTKERQTRKGKRLGKVKAYRYIRDTVNQYEETVLSRIEKDIGIGIVREWRRLAGRKRLR